MAVPGARGGLDTSPEAARVQIGGSIASSVYGVPRATMGADIVADLRPEHIEPLVALLQDRYYISREAVSDAIRRRSSFNLIHSETMFKVDVFVLSEHPYAQEAFRRTRWDTLMLFSLSAPEDVILNKLAWFRMGGETSERQWIDVLGVLRVQEDRLDFAYMHHWAAVMGLTDLLERAIREAQIS